MNNSSITIENFLKKYRSAVAAKSKEIRLSTEEATDVIAAFVMISDDNKILHTKLDKIVELLSKNQEKPDVLLSGGKF